MTTLLGAVGILCAVLALYLATGLVWAVRRRIWDQAAENVLEVADEKHPHFQILTAIAILLAGSFSVIRWPYIEWLIRGWEREAFEEDSAIMEVIAEEFRELPFDRRISILRRCSPKLLRMLRDRFQED
jgi:hypothetical protein